MTEAAPTRKKQTDTWKAVERKIAGWFRGVRAPLSGRNGGAGTSGDYVGRPWLYLEIKHYARMAIFTLWKDTADKAKRERRRPIVVCHEKGTQNYIAVCDAKWLAAVIDLLDNNGASPDPLAISER